MDVICEISCGQDAGPSATMCIFRDITCAQDIEPSATMSLNVNSARVPGAGASNDMGVNFKGA